MSYQGYIRTSLSAEERKSLKRAASSEGRTLTGYIDRLLRGRLEEIAKISGRDENGNNRQTD